MYNNANRQQASKLTTQRRHQSWRWGKREGKRDVSGTLALLAVCIGANGYDVYVHCICGTCMILRIHDYVLEANLHFYTAANSTRHTETSHIEESRFILFLLLSSIPVIFVFVKNIVSQELL